MSFFDKGLNLETGGIFLCMALVVLGVVIYVWHSGALNGILG